jgi:conjugative relaxase-like TrwC/TraI family protein
MLSMSAMSGGQAQYYLGLAREDYYLEGGEPPGKWYGEGIAKFGLEGEVQPDQLYNLFDGLSPDGTKEVVQLQRHDGKAEHRPGWDLTFSAPKSVSVLWSQSSEENRQIIQRAHRQAVESALDYLQDTAAKTRRGKGGAQLERAGLIIACFEHSTSRALDPQLHIHALVMNIGVREDGTIGTVSSLSIFQSKMVLGALYRMELATILEQEFGVPVTKHRTWFEILGVPQHLMDEFSKRREIIEAELERKGVSSAEASAVTAIETREVKEAVARSVLFKDWQGIGQALGWSTVEADALYNVVPRGRDKEMELANAISFAAERLTSRQAHFTARDFTRFAAEEAQASGLLIHELVAGVNHHLAHSSEIVRLGRYYGEDRFTTREMLDLEQSLLKNAGLLANNVEHELYAETVIRCLSKNGSLSEEQSKAVWHLTTDTGAIAVVSGMAGTGKTMMLNAARTAWEEEGYEVFGAALTAQAEQELTKGAGIKSSTIAKLLIEIEMGRSPLHSKSILVVDEAGMVATPDMERLIRHCNEVGAKLALIGDGKQIQPIGPGAPFVELGARYGQAELQDIRRQNDVWARRAVKDIAEGNAQAALDEYVSRGLVKVTDTRKEAMQALVNDWFEERTPLKECLILAATRADVKSLNTLAQTLRLEEGALTGEPVSIGEDRFYVGDRVMFTKNHRAMGFVNGSRGVIESFDTLSDRVSVRLDSGDRVSFEPGVMNDISLGYAATTHKAQGATSSRTYILAGGTMQDREMSYVQASRSREQTRFYMTRLESGDEIAHLAREMERSRQKDMASTVLRVNAEKYNERER